MSFWLAFIPLFVAIDVVGTIPLFLNLSREANARERRGVIAQAIATAFAIALVMILAGKAIFSFLGITIGDFQIAGGLILLVISVRDLVTQGGDESKVPYDVKSFGVVPLGIPLTLGPAALTTLLILTDSVGIPLTLASLLVNLIIVWIAFSFAPWIERALTKNGSAAVAKVASLLMAAIAVMMIRQGITKGFLE